MNFRLLLIIIFSLFMASSVFAQESNDTSSDTSSDASSDDSSDSSSQTNNDETGDTGSGSDETQSDSSSETTSGSSDGSNESQSSDGSGSNDETSSGSNDTGSTRDGSSTGAACPADEELQRQMETCKQSSGGYSTFIGPSGCTEIQCDPVEGKPPLPAGCTEVSENGFTRIKCDQPASRCPPLDPNAKIDMEKRCQSYGSQVTLQKDPMGCEFYTCASDNGGGFLMGPSKCMSPEAVDSILADCKARGYESFVEKKGSCLVPVCKPSREQFNNPKEQCAKYGGEYVERVEEGRVVFSSCVQKGFKTDVKVKPVEDIPDSADLLQLAFKLESLRIKFDELSQKSKDIAAYYDGSGDTVSAERYTKVSSMFLSAKDEVDKLKTSIAEKAKGTVTKKDMLDIRHDVNYLKEVVMKNILFQMLGSDERVTEASLQSQDCTDNECFENAVITCEAGTQFSPEGGFQVTLRGVEGERCVMHVERGSSSMTCKIPDYSLGLRDPSTQVFPYCEGDLVSDVKSRMDMTGPGGCSGPEECESYCSDPANMDECMEFARAQGFSDPNEPRLEDYRPEMSGPGGCQTAEGCSAYCSDPANNEECGISPIGGFGGGFGGPSEGPGGFQPEFDEGFRGEPAQRVVSTGQFIRGII